VAPDWTLDRRETLAMISEEMKRRDSSQGKQLMEIQSGFEL
jgi:radical SAM superfamily enzyme